MIDRLRSRPPRLFVGEYSAWEHFAKHVLNNKGEWASWAVLLPELAQAAGAGRQQELHELAREGAPGRPPADLRGLWEAFRSWTRDGLDRGIELGWVWEVEPRSGECGGRVLAPSGLLFFADEEVARTGFLPFKDGVDPMLGDEEKRYQLYLRCREKAARQHYHRRVIAETAELNGLMLAEPTLTRWRDLAGVRRTGP